jgi:hypothetical protein
MNKTGREIQLYLLKRGRHPSKLTQLPRPIPEPCWNPDLQHLQWQKARGDNNGSNREDRARGHQWGSGQLPNGGNVTVADSQASDGAGSKFLALRERIRAKERLAKHHSQEDQLQAAVAPSAPHSRKRPLEAASGQQYRHEIVDVGPAAESCGGQIVTRKRLRGKQPTHWT